MNICLKTVGCPWPLFAEFALSQPVLKFHLHFGFLFSFMARKVALTTCNDFMAKTVWLILNLLNFSFTRFTLFVSPCRSSKVERMKRVKVEWMKRLTNIAREAFLSCFDSMTGPLLEVCHPVLGHQSSQQRQHFSRRCVRKKLHCL